MYIIMKTLKSRRKQSLKQERKKIILKEVKYLEQTCHK